MEGTWHTHRVDARRVLDSKGTGCPEHRARVCEHRPRPPEHGTHEMSYTLCLTPQSVRQNVLPPTHISLPRSPIAAKLLDREIAYLIALQIIYSIISKVSQNIHIYGKTSGNI